MKDIDFDELDRAVTSILGNKAQTPGDSAATPAARPDQPLAPESTPSPAAPASPVTPTPTPTPPSPRSSTPAVPQRRTTGRFMDVVHPSANMRPSIPASPTSAPTVAERTVQPLSANIVPDPPKAPVEAENAPIISPIPPTVDPTTLVSTPDTKDTAWPDPLDIHELAAEATGTEAPPAQPPDDSPTSIPVASAPEAPTTPFLAGAKVEKRPLGAFATNATEEPPTPADTAPATEPPQPHDDEQLPPEVPPALSSNEPLPPELDSHLVDLEGTDQLTNAPKPITPVTTETASSPATLSIPQQYKTTERSSDAGEHPVFDAAEYHAPLPSQPAKRSPSGMIIVLLVILLLAAAGAGWYFFLR